jgi:hypothetical protein
VVQRGLREQVERVGLLLDEARRLVIATLWVQRLAGGGERAQEQCTHFRSQPPAENDHAVLLLIDVERAAHVMPGGLPRLGQPVRPAPAAHDALDMIRGAGAAHRQESLFRLWRRHAGQRADLGVRQLAGRESAGEARQRAQRPSDAHALTGGARIEAHTPAQPGSAGAKAAVPALAGVELADAVEEASSGSVEVRGELGDLIAEPVQLYSTRRGGTNARRIQFHGCPLLGRIYTPNSRASARLQDCRIRMRAIFKRSSDRSRV